MTSAQGSGRGLGFTLAIAAVAVAATLIVVLLTRTPTAQPPAATPAASQATRGTSAASAGTTSPTAHVDCTEETGTSAVPGAACPSAILAIQLAVAPVRLPIDRIVIEPGPFYCDVIWPGRQSVPPCRGYAVRPGQFMHAWVSFRHSDKVAVVALGLNLPDVVASPGASRPPWHATLVTLEIPPEGWLMP